VPTTCLPRPAPTGIRPPCGWCSRCQGLPVVRLCRISTTPPPTTCGETVVRWCLPATWIGALVPSSRVARWSLGVCSGGVGRSGLWVNRPLRRSDPCQQAEVLHSASRTGRTGLCGNGWPNSRICAGLSAFSGRCLGARRRNPTGRIARAAHGCARHWHHWLSRCAPASNRQAS
jgi:hypothetical protein